MDCLVPGLYLVDLPLTTSLVTGAWPGSALGSRWGPALHPGLAPGTRGPFSVRCLMSVQAVTPLEKRVSSHVSAWRFLAFTEPPRATALRPSCELLMPH